MKERIKISLSTIFSIVPILYFNSCTLGFIKRFSFVLPVVLALTAAWIVVAIREKRTIEGVALKSFFYIFVVILFLFGISFLGIAGNISNLQTAFKNTVFIPFFMAVFVIYADNNHKNDRIFILSVWLLDTIICCVYSIIRLAEDPLLSRLLSTGSFLQTSEGEAAVGVISFGGVYGLVLVSIAVMAFLHQRKKKRLFYSLIFTIFLITIIEAQFMLSIILLIVGIVCILLTDSLAKRKVIGALLLLVGAIAILLFSPILIELLIKSGFLGEAVNERLEDIRLLLMGNQMKETTDIMLRFNRYWTSISAFLSSFGMGALWNKSLSSGGHSQILDGFANYGVGYLVFIVAIASFYKYICSKLSGDALRTYKIVFWIYIAISFLNTSIWAQIMQVLFVIIPFFCMDKLNSESTMNLDE